MLRHFLEKVHNRRTPGAARIMHLRPVRHYPSGKAGGARIAESAGAREVYLIEEPMAAAIGAGLPINRTQSQHDRGHRGRNDGSGGDFPGRHRVQQIRPHGGRQMDDAILQHIKRKYNLLIAWPRPKSSRRRSGTLIPQTRWKRLRSKEEICHRDSENPHHRFDEVRKAISEQVETIVETVRIALEQTPRIGRDIVDTGIVLTGGGSLLKNLDVLLREETKLPIRVTQDPLAAVVLGSEGLWTT